MNLTNKTFFSLRHFNESISASLRYVSPGWKGCTNEGLLERVREDPSASTWCRFRQLWILRTSLKRLLKRISLFPYYKMGATFQNAKGHNPDFYAFFYRKKKFSLLLYKYATRFPGSDNGRPYRWRSLTEPLLPKISHGLMALICSLILNYWSKK